MSWVILILAGCFEVVFTTCLKLSNNFTHIGYTVCFAIFAILSFGCLNWTLKVIPIGTAYGVWTGIGAAGTVIMGIFFFGESSDLWRVFFISLLIISIIGLKIVSPGH